MREPSVNAQIMRNVLRKLHTGTSAYELAVANGYVGTLSAWLTSLQGQSAYQLAVAQGFVGTEAQWIASISIVTREADNISHQKNGVNPQNLRLYETYTNSTNYERASFSMGSDALDIKFESDGTGSANGSIILTPKGNGRVKIQAGINPDSSGIKHKRVTTGSISAGATALITVTWTTAFADANYSVCASVVDSTTAAASLQIVHIESISASAVTIRVENSSAGPLTGTLHVIAIHD